MVEDRRPGRREVPARHRWWLLLGAMGLLGGGFWGFFLFDLGAAFSGIMFFSGNGEPAELHGTVLGALGGCLGGVIAGLAWDLLVPRICHRTPPPKPARIQLAGDQSSLPPSDAPLWVPRADRAGRSNDPSGGVTPRANGAR